MLGKGSVFTRTVDPGSLAGVTHARAPSEALASALRRHGAGPPRGYSLDGVRPAGRRRRGQSPIGAAGARGSRARWSRKPRTARSAWRQRSRSGFRRDPDGHADAGHGRLHGHAGSCASAAARLPIIALTAHAMKGFEREVLEAGLYRLSHQAGRHRRAARNARDIAEWATRKRSLAGESHDQGGSEPDRCDGRRNGDCGSCADRLTTGSTPAPRCGGTQVRGAAAGQNERNRTGSGTMRDLDCTCRDGPLAEGLGRYRRLRRLYSACAELWKSWSASRRGQRPRADGGGNRRAQLLEWPDCQAPTKIRR